MLTVKLHGVRHRNLDGTPAPTPDIASIAMTKILEAKRVDIFWIRLGLAEVSTVAADGTNEAFYVSDPTKPRPEGFAAEVEFWDEAFVENSHGSTTQTVRFWH